MGASTTSPIFFVSGADLGLLSERRFLAVQVPFVFALPKSELGPASTHKSSPSELARLIAACSTKSRGASR